MAKAKKKKPIAKELYVICYEDETPYANPSKAYAYRTIGLAEQRLLQCQKQLNNSYIHDKDKHKQDPQWLIDNPAPQTLIICKWVPQSERLIFLDTTMHD